MGLRMKQTNSRRKSDYGLPDYRLYYKERYGELKVSDSEFNSIIKEFYERVFEEVVFKGFQFNLPGSLGVLTLSARKPVVELDSEYNVVRTNVPINYKATNELWASDPEAKAKRLRVYHDNVSTDGNIYSIRWVMDKRFRSHFMSVYGFKPSRSNSRKLAKTLKLNGV